MLYNKHRNFCINLVKTEKKIYYNNLSLNIFEDNKTFWERIKPFPNKKKEAEKLNNFFIEAVKNLDIELLNNNDDKPLLFNDIDGIISHSQTSWYLENQ